MPSAARPLKSPSKVIVWYIQISTCQEIAMDYSDPAFARQRVRYRPPALVLYLGSIWIAFGGFSRAFAQRACDEVKLGTPLPNPTLQDANKHALQLPDLGEKVLLILYTDPDVADQNDPFADRVKAQHLDQTHFRSVGIANMEDAPAKPNWIIRAIVRNKIKKYNVTILTDPDRSLARQWRLCDCNEKSVVMVIGKDKKLKYLKKGALNEKETHDVIELLRKLISESGTP
jgi:predicted transcriptional regulator